MPRRIVFPGFGSIGNHIFPEPRSLGTIDDLTATALVESVKLEWTPAENATSQQPQYSPNGQQWINYGSALAGNAISVTLTGLTAGVEYSFRVVASDGTYQTISNVVQAAPATQPLNAGVIFATAGNGFVTISQTMTPSGGTGVYTLNLYRSTTQGQLGSLIALDIELPYVDDDVDNDVTYYYTLRVADGNTSSDSNQISATPESAASWATGEWELLIGGQPGSINFTTKIVVLPEFGAVAASISVGSNTASVSFTLPGFGAGSMSLTHSDGELSGTATVAGITVAVTGAPAGQLKAGTITANAGDGVVTIIQGVAPSGGLGSYTSNLYRSTTSGQKGSIIQSNVSLPYDDESVVNDVTYYYVREVSDGQSTVDTPQIVATPHAGSVAPLFQDDFEAYANGAPPTGGANGFQWTSARYSYVSTDISHSGTKSLKFSYGPTEPNGQSHWWSEQRFSHPPITEYWAEFYIYFPDGTEGLGARYEHASNNANNKFWTYWGPGYSDPPAGNASLWGRGGGDSNVGFINVGGGWSGAGLGPLVVGNGDRGRWMQIRLTIKTPDYGQSNGHMRLWKDGVLVTQRTGEPTRVNSPSQNYLNAGYILGYDNARFTQNTFIYVDDLKFYTQNPGW